MIKEADAPATRQEGVEMIRVFNCNDEQIGTVKNSRISMRRVRELAQKGTGKAWNPVGIYAEQPLFAHDDPMFTCDIIGANTEHELRKAVKV